MALEINKKQKLLLEYTLADRAVFIKLYRIMVPTYFDSPLDRVVEFINNHFEKHHNIPSIDIIEAETGIYLEARQFESESEVTYLLDEMEKHCQDEAMAAAILEGVNLLESGRRSEIPDLVRKALLVKIDASVGTELFLNPESRIEETNDGVDERSCGIKALDELIGNIRRQELGLVFAPTSGGKSVMLANLALNLAAQGLDTCVISIELNEQLYSKRMDAIATGYSIKEHLDLKSEIATALNVMKTSYGNIVVKKMKYGSTVEDIRAYLMEYHLKFGKYPDALFVDYLGIMGAGGGSTKYMGKFELDEIKAFSLRDMIVEFNMYGFSAGQINREGYDVVNLGPQHVAGGISVINASDWSVGMVGTEEDINNNQLQLVQMKIRNHGSQPPAIIYKNPANLRMTDKPSSQVQSNRVKTQPVPKVATLNGKDKLKAALNRSRK